MLQRLSRLLLLGVLLCAAAVACWAALARAPLLAAAGLLSAAAVAAGAGRLGAAGPRVGSALLALLCLPVLVWALAVDSHQVSDFGVYFRCGGEFVSDAWDFQAWASRCESQWLPGFASYWRRSLFYTLPVGLLSAGDYTALKLANAVYHGAAIVLAYFMSGRAFGRAAGLVSAALLSIYPEFWFATTVATPDNLVPLGLLLFMLAVAGIEKSGASAGRIVAVLVIVALLDLLRSLGPILAVALAWYGLAAEGRSTRTACLLLAAACAAQVLLLGLLPSWVGVSGAQHTGLLTMLVGNGLSHPRAFAENYTWNQYVLPALDGAHRQSLVLGLVAQDLQGALQMPWHWMRKLAQLFGAEGYYFFSATGALGSADDYLLQGRVPTVVFRPAVAAFLAGIVAFTCVAGAVGALRAGSHPLIRAGLATAVAILLYIALVGETQARYSIMVAPGLCIAAAGLALQASAPRRAAAVAALRALGVTALAGLVVVVAGKAWAAQRLADSGTLAWRSDPGAGAACAGTITVQAHWVVAAVAPGQCLSLSALPERVSGQVGFYVVRTPSPPRWDHRPQEPVALTLVSRYADGTRSEARRVLGPGEAVLHVSVPADRLAELTILVAASRLPQTQVAFTYFHDEKNVITNRPR